MGDKPEQDTAGFKPFIDALANAMGAHPEQRICQVLVNALGADPFHVSNSDAIERLWAYASGMER